MARLKSISLLSVIVIIKNQFKFFGFKGLCFCSKYFFPAMFRSQFATPMVVMLCLDFCISLVFASVFGDNLGISVTSLVQGASLGGERSPNRGSSQTSFGPISSHPIVFPTNLGGNCPCWNQEQSYNRELRGGGRFRLKLILCLVNLSTRLQGRETLDVHS